MAYRHGTHRHAHRRARAQSARVLLTIDTTGCVGDTLAIYRVEGSESTIVRDSETTPDIADVTWIGYDYEAPYGTAVTYQVVIFSAGTTVASATSSSTTVSETSPWLVHPGDPDLSVELVGLRQIGARKRPSPKPSSASSDAPTQSSPPTVAATSKAHSRSAPAPLAEITALVDLVADGTPLLLNVPASLLWE